MSIRNNTDKKHRYFAPGSMLALLILGGLLSGPIAGHASVSKPQTERSQGASNALYKDEIRKWTERREALTQAANVAPIVSKRRQALRNASVRMEDLIQRLYAEIKTYRTLSESQAKRNVQEKIQTLLARLENLNRSLGTYAE